MLVSKLIEKMDGNTSVWVKDGHAVCLQYNVKDGIAQCVNTDVLFEDHLSKTVASFHIEPNLDDGGSINWKYPCRIVIEVEENYYPNKESYYVLNQLESWINNGKQSKMC